MKLFDIDVGYCLRLRYCDLSTNAIFLRFSFLTLIQKLGEPQKNAREEGFVLPQMFPQSPFISDPFDNRIDNMEILIHVSD